MTKFKDFEIHREEHQQHAIRDDLKITVEGGTLFHRRACDFGVASQPDLSAPTRSLLVSELDGVYVYVGAGGNVLVTKNASVKP